MEEFCHLIEAVCDECEEKTASKSRKQPHPPRDPHLVEYGGKRDSGGSTDLARLAGYHRGRHRVGLEGKVLLWHKERQPGHPRNQLRRDLHLLCVVLHLGLCEQTRPDFKEHTLVLLERSDSALDHSAARPAACKLRLKLSDGSPTPCSGAPLLLVARFHVARQLVANSLLKSPLHILQHRIAQALVRGGAPGSPGGGLLHHRSIWLGDPPSVVASLVAVLSSSRQNDPSANTSKLPAP